jgi:transcriptional regulator with XRE-family HTH domain
MSHSPSSSAQAARDRLAGRLRDLRLEAGITGHELAARCGWSPAKSSRLENARTLPSDADVRAWCAACGHPDLAGELIAESRQADELYQQWKRLTRGGLRRLQETFLGLHQGSRTQRAYVSNVIPGFLQTADYARALLTTIGRFYGTPDDIDQAVTARRERERILHYGDHRVVAVLEESVLRYRVGDQAVMAGQLEHLREVMRLPSLALGVIPFTAKREQRMWTLEAFYLFDDQRVTAELLSAAVTITAPHEIALYQRAFGELVQLAVFGPAARQLIDDAITALDPRVKERESHLGAG